MSEFIVGVTGGIGSGKSTVTDLFNAHGIDVVDADIVARQIVEPGAPALKSIVRRFGTAILDEKAGLDRAKLRTIVFSNSEDKAWLDNLLHPIIREQLFIQTKQTTSPYCLLSVPLLVENNLYQMVKRVLVVDVNEHSQVTRTVKRDKSNEQQIRSIMKSQASREQRISVADDIIDNNGKPEDLFKQVDKLHRHYLELASRAAGSHLA